jgi:hypothetical protein
LAFPDAMVRTLYPAGRDIDIYLPWSLSCVRWSVSGKRASPRLRPLIARDPACLQGSLVFASGQSATPNLAELVQLRSRGSTTTGTLPSPTGQAGCTELVPLYFCRPPPPWPPLSRSGRGAPAAAPVVQRLPLLSSFARLASPLSLSRQLATIPGIITPRECLALLSCLGPPPAASL